MSGPIQQESYNTIEGYAPNVLKVGTRVVYTNDYGVSFPGKVIERTETDGDGATYYHISGNVANGLPVRRDNLTIEAVDSEQITDSENGGHVCDFQFRSESLALHFIEHANKYPNEASIVTNYRANMNIGANAGHSARSIRFEGTERAITSIINFARGFHEGITLARTTLEELE